MSVRLLIWAAPFLQVVQIRKTFEGAARKLRACLRKGKAHPHIGRLSRLVMPLRLSRSRIPRLQIASNLELTSTNSNSWHSRCSRNHRHVRKDAATLTVPPPPTSPERRLPLRQLPSEQPFSASPRTVNPVRNDWVLPLLGGPYSVAHRCV